MGKPLHALWKKVFLLFGVGIFAFQSQIHAQCTDVNPPTVTWGTSAFANPTDQNMVVAPGQLATALSITPTVTDDCTSPSNINSNATAPSASTNACGTQTYVRTWTFTDDAGRTTTQVQTITEGVTITSAPTGGTVCEGNNDITITAGTVAGGTAPYTYAWTTDNGTITAGANTATPTLNVNGVPGGTTITMTVMVNDASGACSPQPTSTATVTVQAADPVTASVTTSPLCYNDPFNITATPAAGMWTTTGTGAIGNANMATTTYTPGTNETGTVTMTWTPTGACLGAAAATVDLVINPTVATINAGANQTLCNGNPTLAGVITLTDGTSGTGTWSIAGPNTDVSQLSSATALNATFTPTAVGAYTLTLTADDPDGAGPCTGGQTSTVTLTINDGYNTPNPAGADQTICVENAGALPPVTMAASNTTVSGATRTGSWSGGAGTFSSLNDPTATYTPTAGEIGTTVTLTWTLPDPDGAGGPCTGVVDQVDVAFTPGVQTAVGGGAVTTCAGTQTAAAAISATVTLSDGSNYTTGAWTHNGTGSLAAGTSISGVRYTPGASELGNVTLTWTPSGANACNATVPTATVTVSISDGVTGVDVSGSTTTACLENNPPTTAIAITAVNNLASGGTNTNGSWSIVPVSGYTGTGTIAAVGSASTTYTPSAADAGNGQVRLRWTATQPDPSCASQTADVTITLQNGVASATNGANQTVCVATPSVDLTGLVSVTRADGTALTAGTWSTSGSGSFTSASNINTSYNAANDLGSTPVTLTWTPTAACGTPPTATVTITTISDAVTASGLSNSGDQTVCVTASPIPAQNISATVTTVGGAAYSTGTWTTSGSGAFGTATDIATTYTPSAADITAGSVTLTWTVGAGAAICSGAGETTSLTLTLQNGVVANMPVGSPVDVCGTSGTAPIAISATTTSADGNPYTTGFWSTTGSGVFGNAFNQSTTYTPGAADAGNTVTLLWAPTGVCNQGSVAAAQFIINVSDGIETTTNNGPWSLCATTPGSSVNISATVTRRSGAAYTTGMWTTTGTGTFGSTTSISTTYAPTAADITAGSVDLTWTTGDPDGAGPCTGTTTTETLTLTNNGVQTMVGGSTTVCGVAANISATVTLADGSNHLPGTWSGGTGTFGSATTINTTYTPAASEVGSTVNLIWTPSGVCNSPVPTTTFSVTVQDGVNTISGSGPHALCVESGSTNQAISATVTALSGGAYTAGGWTKVSATAGGSFGSTSSASTTYTPSAADITAGSVVVRWTTTGACNNQSTDVTINLQNGVVSATGGSANVCGATATNISATVTQADGTNLMTGTWTSSGSGAFGTATDIATTYTPSVADVGAGNITLTWTPSGAACGTPPTATYTLTLTGGVVMGANTSETVCYTGGAMTFDAANTATTVTLTDGTAYAPGQWSGGAGTFANNSANVPTYTPTNAEIGTTVQFTWTATGACNSPQTATHDVTFTNGIASATAATVAALCGAGQTTPALTATVTSADGTAYNTGTWSHNGTGSLTNANSHNTATYTSAVGDLGNTVTLTWTPSGACNAPTATTTVSVGDNLATALNGGNQSMCITTASNSGNANVPVSAVVTTSSGAAFTGGDWTIIDNGSGYTGSGAFGDATMASTTYTPSAADIGRTVRVRWTTDADCTGGTLTTDVDITVNNGIVATSNNSTTICGSEVGTQQTLGTPIVLLADASTLSTGMWTTTGAGTLANATSRTNGRYTPAAGDVGTTVNFTWTPSGACNTITATYAINIEREVSLAMGADQTACTSSPTAAITATPTLTGGAAFNSGSWSVVSGPSTSTAQFASIGSPSTNFTATGGAGTYTLRWTTNANGTCPGTSGTLDVVVSAAATTASIAGDATLCFDGSNGASIIATATDAAGAAVTAGSWSIIAMPTGDPNGGGAGVPGPYTGTGSFSGGGTNRVATYTPSAGDIGKTVRVQWTTSASCGPVVTATHDITINNGIASVNVTPVVSTVCPGTVINLNAITLLADGTAYNTGSWTTVGSGTLANATSHNGATYTVGVGDVGTGFNITWTPSGACNTMTDNAGVSVPYDIAVTGGSATVCYTGTAPIVPLAVSVQTVQTVPVNITTGAWTGGTGVFVPNRNTINATYTPAASEIGNTVNLTWTPSGAGFCNVTNQTAAFAITINNGINTVSATGDASVCYGATAPTANISATATLANGGAYTAGMWSSSGSGTFGTATMASTTYTPSTADAGSTVTLTWTPTAITGCTPTPTATHSLVVNDGIASVSGGTSTVCFDAATAVAIPAATVTRASGAAYTAGTWSTAGTGTLTNATSIGGATYMPVAGEAGSTVTFTWTPTTGTVCNLPGLTTSSSITFSDAVTSVDAGLAQTACYTSTPATFNLTGSTTLASGAAGTGMWSGGTGTFDDPTSPNANYTANAVEIGGTVTLRWTANDPDGAGPCTGGQFDQVTLTVTDGIASVNAGADQTICQTGTASINATAALASGANHTPGMWSVTAGPAGTFASTTSQSTTFTPTGGVGTYTLRWTSTDPDGIGPCMDVTDDVVITVEATHGATITNATPYCFPTATPSVVLSGGATGGTWSIVNNGLAGAANYTGGGTLTGETTLTPTYTGVAADLGRTIRLQYVTSGGACSGVTRTTDFTFNPRPTVTLPATTNACAPGGTTTVMATATISGTTSANYTYNWSTSDAAVFNFGGSATATTAGVAALTDMVTITGVAPGTANLTVTVTDANGCVSEVATSVVTVHALPDNNIIVEDVSDGCGINTTAVVAQVLNAQPNTTYSVVINGMTYSVTNTASTAQNVGLSIPYAQLQADATYTAAAPGPVNYTVNASNVTSGCGVDLVDNLTVIKGTAGAAGQPTLTATDVELCVGETATINSQVYTGNQVTYYWSSNLATAGIPNNGTLQNNQVTVQPTTAGSYNYRLTVNVDGCQSDTAEVNIITHGLPIVTPEIVDVICGEPDSLLLRPLVTTLNTPASYQWTGPNNFSSVNPTSVIYNPTQVNAGTYTLIVTDSVGCVSSNSVTTTITEDIAAPVISATNSIVCQNENVTLNATSYSASNISNVTYTWTLPGGGTQVTTSPTLSGIAGTDLPNGDYTVSVEVIYSNTTPPTPCSKVSGTFTLTVQTAATATVAQTSQTLCAGDDITVAVSGASANTALYTWTGPNGFTQTSSISGQLQLTGLTVAQSGTYTLSVATSAGCATTYNKTIVVNPKPTQPTITSSDADLSICDGDQITLTAPTYVGGSVSYTWTGEDAPTAATTSNQITVTPTASGNYTVMVSVDGCNSEMTTITITVNDNPDLVVVPITEACVVAGSQLELDDAINVGASTGITGGSYTWSGPNGFNAVGANPTINNVSSADNGVYTVTVTNAAGCTDTESFTVDVSDAVPSVSASVSDATPCAGDQITLTATNFSDPTLSYQWSTVSGGVATPISGATNSTYSLSAPSMSMTYRVVVTRNSGCSTQADVAVNGLASPTTTAATSGATGCATGTQTLNLDAGASNATSYSWTGPNGFTSSQEMPSIPNATAANGGIYTVTVSNANGCTATSSVLVSLSNQPATPAVSVGTPVICNGTSTSLTVPVYTGNTVVYNWTSTNATAAVAGIPAASNTNSINVTPTAAGTYNYDVTVTIDGCTSTAGTASITVEAAPALTAIATTGDITCVNGTSNVTLDATVTGASSYSWTGPNGFTSSMQNPTLNNVTSNTSGTYTLVATSANGCTSTMSYALTITDQPADPTLTASDNAVCAGDAVTLTGTYYGNATAGSGISYVWTANGTAVTNNSNTLVANPTTTTTVTYAVIVDGCQTPTQTTVISVDDTPDIAVAATADVTCVDGTTSYTFTAPTVNAGSNLTYSWTGPNGFTGNTATPIIPNVNSTNSGTYTVTATSPNGCTDSENIQLTVTDQPADPALTASDVSICLGETITLFGTNYNVGTNGNASYNWTGNGVTGNPQTSTISVTPTMTGTISYTYDVTIAGCTSTQATVNINVEDAPVITGVGTASDITCLDGTTNVTLDATVTGAVSTVWTGPNGYSSTSMNAVVVDATSADNGTYTLTATSANGCTSTATFNLSVTDQPADPTLTASDMTICLGESITLIGTNYNVGTTGTLSYNWTGDGLSSTTSSTVIATPTTTGSQVYTYSVSIDGCTSTTASINVSVEDAPMVSITTPSAASTQCVDGTTPITLDAVITATPAVSTVWSGPNGYSSTSEDAQILNVTSANSGTYTLVATSANGCQTVASITIDITDQPADPTLTASDYNTCNGDVVTLTGTNFNVPSSSSITYNWVANGTTITNNSSTLVVNPTATTVYDYSVTIDGCTSGIATVTINVEDAPVITGVGTASDITCLDGTTNVTLDATVTGATSTVWTGPNGYSSSMMNAVIIDATSADNGTYTLTATSANGCTSTTTFNLSITDQPADPTLTASDYDICNGETVTLTGTNFNVPSSSTITYDWIANGTTIVNNSSTLVVTPAVTTTYDYGVTIDGCFSALATVTVNVEDAPVITGVGTSSNTTCVDGTTPVTIDATVTGAVSTVWSGPNGYSSTSEDALIPNATSANNGTYTLTATSMNGCVSTATFNLTVTDQPADPTLTSSNLTICLGQSITLTGTNYNVGTNGSISYNWNGNGITGSPQTSTITVTPTTTGTLTYTYDVTIAGCTSTSATVMVSVEDAPNIASITPSGNTTCVDGTTDVTLDATVTGAVSTVWSGPNGYSSTAEDPVLSNVTSANSGAYTLTATSANGCVSTSTINLTITDQPVAPTVVANPNAICLGDDVVLTATSYTGGTVQYNWTATPAAGSGVIGAINSNQVTVIPTAAGTYTYQLTVDVDGCPSNAGSVTVVVETVPTVQPTYNGPITCTDGSTDLVLSAGGTGGSIWIWSGPNGFSSSDQNPVITNATSADAGTYTVTSISGSGCGSTTASIVVEITDSPAAPSLVSNDNVICLDDNIVLTTTNYNGGTVQYNWSATPAAGSGIASAPNSNQVTITPTAAGTYTYSVSVDVDGCPSLAADVTVVVEQSITANGQSLTTVPYHPHPGFTNGVLNTDNYTAFTNGNGSVLANDVYDLNQATTVAIFSDVSNGSLTLNNDGTFEYTPNIGFLGTDQFTYILFYANTSNPCASDTATVTFEIVRPALGSSVSDVPNIITPNGDGVNDALVIPSIGTLPNHELIIYNQWGDIVYQTTDYNNNWEGTYNGEALPDGTYYYIFKPDVTNESQNQYGFITIIR